MNLKLLNISIAIVCIAVNASAQQMGSFTDARDGKVYKTVTIGKQTWLAENLAYKADGSCWAYDDDKSNIATYGYLYDWETAKASCPAGWHLPTELEWLALTSYISGETPSSIKLKEKGNTHWLLTGDATNESNFTALPGGNRTALGAYDNLTEKGLWWSGTSINAKYAWDHTMNAADNDMSGSAINKNQGLSVRCIKD